MIDWTDETRLERGGHRVFYDAERDRWAIADNSGRWPERTDDGVLWVVPLQTIELREGESASVRLTHDGGGATATSMGWDAALRLSELIDGIDVVLVTKAGQRFSPLLSKDWTRRANELAGQGNLPGCVEALRWAGLDDLADVVPVVDTPACAAGITGAEATLLRSAIAKLARRVTALESAQTPRSEA